MDVRLSVLDTSPIVAGSTARQALAGTVDLAVLADELGYHRYWVPEHHGMRGVASSAPAVVAGRLAAATRHIRVGAGGVLLPNHPPIVVAEQFGTLTAFHPGRIDLGLGRAGGGPRHAVDLVRGDRTTPGFREQVEELIGYFAEPGPAIPASGNTPEIWLLGSSPDSARLAGELGLAYAFAHHLNPGDAAEAMRTYRSAFRPSALSAPKTVVSVSVIAAETGERAEWLARPARVKVLRRLRGERILLPSPADAASGEPADLADRLFVGSPETVRERLQAVVDETGADELMLTTPVYDHHDRRRSYELLARAGPGRVARLLPG